MEVNAMSEITTQDAQGAQDDVVEETLAYEIMLVQSDYY
jgi:hypothetical protein